MSEHFIKDGTGDGYVAGVDAKNRLAVHATIVNHNEEAAENGDAYNIHSGAISLSAAGTLLYVKNNEVRDLFLENLVVALGEATVSDSPEIMTYKAVTAGDLLTDETAVAFESNRNFGSANILSADCYAGKSAGTVTAEQIGLYYMNANSRLIATINKVLPRGASMAIAIDPKLSSGTVKAYAVLVCHLRDSADSE